MAGTLPSSNPNDFKCPICLDLLYDPVTLPCSHAMCYSCFHTNRDESNLHCPLCRTRYSVWARRLAKKGPRAFIDERRAEKIKHLFPDLYERRVNGCGEQVISDDPQPAVLSNTGAIREEYEQLLKQVQAEREAEDIASQPVLVQLRAEAEAERQRLAEMERQSAEDEHLARKLAEEDNDRHQTISPTEQGAGASHSDKHKSHTGQSACSSSCSCGGTRTLFPLPPVKRRRSGASTLESSTAVTCRQGLASWLRRETSSSSHHGDSGRGVSSCSSVVDGGDHKHETLPQGECSRELEEDPSLSDSPGSLEIQHWLVDIEQNDHKLMKQQIEADRQLALRIQQQLGSVQTDSAPSFPDLKHGSENPPATSPKTPAGQIAVKATVHSKTPPSNIAKKPPPAGQSLLSRWLGPLVPKRLKV